MEKTLDKNNEAKATQITIMNKDLKYQYPKGMIDSLERKGFRQMVRNAIRRMERQVTKLKGTDRKNKKAEIEAYMEKYLT